MRLAAAIIVINPEGKILLLDRAYPPFGYGLVGGAVEDDESNMEAAIRETIEEIQVEFSPYQFQYHTTDISADRKWQVIIYKIELQYNIDVIINEEHYSFIWADDAQYKALNFAGNTKRFIDSCLLNKKKYKKIQTT